MTVTRMDNVGIVVEDLDAAIEFIRGPEGILIGLVQQLGQQAARANPVRQR